MKKYVLLCLVWSLSTIGVAGAAERIEECNEYWKPKIEKIKGQLQSVKDERENSWEQSRKDGLESFLRQRLEAAEAARKMCLTKGLKSSIENYKPWWYFQC